ncbi:uncharacterized protein LOC126316797 [Schistocerca gregaria]|uniref:uncharacterized protein LOC126316797 n=1 Tax=Schistocerca gregaria TaxID=7010 RepID=UPI00211E4D2E|nr:uncharacterized protein LOC126316797 [Schistocerca gregaria]
MKKSSTWLQYRLLCAKRFQICYRNSSLVKLALLPVLIVLVHYVINVAFSNMDGYGDLRVNEYDFIDKIPDYCANKSSDKQCYNMVYAPANAPWVGDMMKELANASGLSVESFKGIDLGGSDSYQSLVEFINDTLGKKNHFQGFSLFYDGKMPYDLIKVSDHIVKNQMFLADQLNAISDSISGKSPQEVISEWIKIFSQIPGLMEILDVTPEKNAKLIEILGSSNSTPPSNPSYLTFYYANTTSLPFVQATVHLAEKYCFYRHFADKGLNTSGIQYNIEYSGYPSPLGSITMFGLSEIVAAVLYNLISTIIFSAILSDLVNEKYFQLRTTLHQAGLTRTAYFLSWITYILVVSFISALTMCTIGVALPLEMFRNSNFLVLLIIYFTLNFSMGCLALFISTFIQVPNSALTVSYVIIMLGAFLQFFLVIGNGLVVQLTQASTSVTTIIVRVILNMFPFGVSAYIYNIIIALTSYVNKAPIGLGFSSFTEEYAELLPYYPTLLSIYYRLWIIALVALILYWYFDNVLFKVDLKRRPAYFFLTPSYWGIRRKRRSAETEQSVFEPHLDSCDSADSSAEDEYRRAVEAAQSDMEKDIAINAINVTKVYRPWYSRERKAFTAVNHLSLSIKRGEFFTILGHNGAGKTTLFSVLNGRSSMTDGYAHYFGYGLRDDPETVRNMMGCCLQHDTFWPELTALEHLDLFHRLRGVEKGELKDQGMELLRLLDLEGVANQKADSFSGGMKRRLSFAISCTGDPQILFLDEPSSGLDPENYKRLWQVLQSMKGRVTIVLVTHNMMEAELLSDRVGVMVNGQFKAIGTVLGLKSKFGYGYQITVCTEEGQNEAVARNYREKHPYLNVRECEGDKTRLEMDVRKCDIERIPELLSTLERDGAVKAWNVSQSSLESVFMSIAEKYDLKKVYDDDSKMSERKRAKEEKKVKALENSKKGFDNNEVPAGEKVKSYPLSALFELSWVLQFRRNRYSTGFVILLPILVLMLLVPLRSYLRSEYQNSASSLPLTGIPIANFNSFMSPTRSMCRSYCDFARQVSPDPSVDLSLLGFDAEGKFAGELGTTYFSYFPEHWCLFSEFPPPPVLTTNDERQFREEMYDSIKNRVSSAPSTDMQSFNVCAAPLPYVHTEFHDLSIDLRNATAPIANMNVKLSVNDYVDKYSPYIRYFIRRDVSLVARDSKSIDKDSFEKLNVFARIQEFVIHLRLYRAFLSASIGPAAEEIPSEVVFVPIPPEDNTELIDQLIAEIFSIGILPYSFSLFIPLSLYGLAKENSDRTKKMMYIHGLPPAYYYINVALTWGVIYLVSSILFIFFGLAFDIDFIAASTSAFSLILLGWGLAFISFVLLVSTFICTTSTAVFVGFGVAIFLCTAVSSVAVQLYDPTDSFLHPLPTWLYFWLQTCLLRCLKLISTRKDGAPLVGQIWEPPLNTEFVRSLSFLYVCALVYFVLFLISLIFYTGDFSYPHYLAVRLWTFVAELPRRALRRFFPAKRPSPEAAPLLADPSLPIQTGIKDVQAEEALVCQYVAGDSLPDTPLHNWPLVIQGLRKKYPGGKVAVKEFYLHAPLSTCFGLLGENGAGKSTLLSMLTGTIPITSGTAYICSFDISRQLSSALKCIGYCPQHDVLWGELTVQEHLEFYARLGGVRPSKSRKYVKKFLWDVGLYHCRHRQSSKLSGGMKRRLSLSIAICANSYVVFLDEPSCGLDVMNKRQIWHIVQNNKHGRTVIITTHGMDEAETLCDKIGVMAQGSLWCYGNPQYIRNLYNQGTYLRVVFSDETLGSNFIKQRIPSSVAKYKFSKTTQYYVPSSQPLSSVFQTLLNSSTQTSGIEDWGLSQPGLEYAFEQIVNHVRNQNPSTTSVSHA